MRERERDGVREEEGETQSELEKEIKTQSE